MQGNITEKLNSMKWEPVIIRWCLYLRHPSRSSAYEVLRESGIIKLPAQRTLRDYTYFTKLLVVSLKIWIDS